MPGMDDIKDKVKDVIDRVTGGDDKDEMDERAGDERRRAEDNPIADDSPALVVPPQGGLPGIAPRPDPSIEPEGLDGDRDERRAGDSGRF